MAANSREWPLMKVVQVWGARGLHDDDLSTKVDLAFICGHGHRRPFAFQRLLFS
jgi:hypothetical protein